MNYRLDVILLKYSTYTQVFRRLYKLGLCTTYKTLVKMLDEAAEGHDERVLDWQSLQMMTLQEPTVSKCICK